MEGEGKGYTSKISQSRTDKKWVYKGRSFVFMGMTSSDLDSLGGVLDVLLVLAGARLGQPLLRFIQAALAESTRGRY